MSPQDPFECDFATPLGPVFYIPPRPSQEVYLCGWCCQWGREWGTNTLIIFWFKASGKTKKEKGDKSGTAPTRTDGCGHHGIASELCRERSNCTGHSWSKGAWKEDKRRQRSQHPGYTDLPHKTNQSAGHPKRSVESQARQCQFSNSTVTRLNGVSYQFICTVFAGI